MDIILNFSAFVSPSVKWVRWYPTHTDMMRMCCKRCVFMHYVSCNKKDLNWVIYKENKYILAHNSEVKKSIRCFISWVSDKSLLLYYNMAEGWQMKQVCVKRRSMCVQCLLCNRPLMRWLNCSCMCYSSLKRNNSVSWERHYFIHKSKDPMMYL